MPNEIEFAPPPRPSITIALRPRPQVADKTQETPKSSPPVSGTPKAGKAAPDTFLRQAPKDDKSEEILENDYAPDTSMALARPVAYVVEIPREARQAWANLGFHTPTVSGRTIDKRVALPADKEAFLAHLMAQADARLTIGDTQYRVNGLTAWAAENAATSPEAFAQFLHAYGHEPKLMFDLVHVAPELFTAHAVRTLLPGRIADLAATERGPRRITDGLWHTGCRLLEGFVKNLTENPPLTMANEHLTTPHLRAKRFPTKYIAAANLFEKTERDLLGAFKDDATSRRLVGEWFSGAASRRFCAPALKRSNAEGMFLEHISDITHRLQPSGGFSRFWDRAYVLRESQALKTVKHAGGSVLHGAGKLVTAMLAGTGGYHAAMGMTGYSDFGYIQPRREPSPVRVKTTTVGEHLKVHREPTEVPKATRRAPKTPVASRSRMPMEDANGAGPSNYAL